LENDTSVVDWDKGLSEEQTKVIKPVSTISKSAIEQACIAFRNAALGTEGDEPPLETEIEDVTVYEHTDFPGKSDECCWMIWTRC
jgi:alkylated DNA repair protein alkB family protein 1